MDAATKRRSWIPRYTQSPVPKSPLADSYGIDSPEPTTPTSPPPLSRESTFDSPPTTPNRWSTSVLLTSSPQQLDQEASQLILNALERSNSSIQGGAKPTEMTSSRGSFSKMSFSSVMGGLSALSLSRTNTNSSAVDDKEREKDKDKERGRSTQKGKHGRSSSHAPPQDEPPSRSASRARSQSPFSFRRFRRRDDSPTPEPIPLATSDVDPIESTIRPRTAFGDDGDDTDGETDPETDDEGWSDDDLDVFDPVTEQNTERNVFIEPPPIVGDGDVEDPDPLGEGVNVVVPPEPYFPSTLNYAAGSSSTTKGRNPRRKKSLRHHEPLPLQTSRPIFQRDRCTITLTQGDPESKLEGRRPRRYIVGSDMSEESRYAVEWGIGTVLRDGDEMLIVTVVENENKSKQNFNLSFRTYNFASVDPAIANPSDRTNKVRSQQEVRAHSLEETIDSQCRLASRTCLHSCSTSH